MPGKIDPKSLSPRLPSTWKTFDRQSTPDSQEIDQMLQGKPKRPAWRDAGHIPMTLDPVTRMPMVDPVLCSDGKLHDRTAVRPLPYLDPDVTTPRHLRVLGRDLDVRAAVHQTFPVASNILKSRTAFAAWQQSIKSDETASGAMPNEASEPEKTASREAASEMQPGEAAFRKYQLRVRKCDLVMSSVTVFTHSPQRPRALTFSRHTFSHFKVLPKNVGERLVDHLVRHNVLLGRGRDARFLGCTEFLERTLDTFGRPHGGLTEQEKHGVRKYVQFFERMHRQAWQTIAELENCFGLILQSVSFRSNDVPELVGLRTTEQFLATRRWELFKAVYEGSPEDTSPPLRTPGNVPAAKRVQSLPDLRLSADPEAVDSNVYLCPLFLDAAPAPVLCSDGHTYDLSQVLKVALAISPLTREPMSVVGRHDEKQTFAAQIIDKLDADYFEETYEILRGAYDKPKVGGFEDRVVQFQRRRRFFGILSARPESFRAQAFSAEKKMSRRLSSKVVTKLCDIGLFNRALDRRARPDMNYDLINEALARSVKGYHRLGVTEKSDYLHIVTTFFKEQLRRDPLVAQARVLKAQLKVAPKNTPRYEELQEQFEQVNQELHKLPSGATDGSKRTLY